MDALRPRSALYANAVFLGMIVLILLHVSAPAIGDETLATQPVADGLTAPNLLTHAGDGSGRLFIVDQTGQIRIVDAGGNRLKEAFASLEQLELQLGKDKERVTLVREAENVLADAVSSSAGIKASAHLSPAPIDTY